MRSFARLVMTWLVVGLALALLLVVPVARALVPVAVAEAGFVRSLAVGFAAWLALGLTLGTVSTFAYGSRPHTRLARALTRTVNGLLLLVLLGCALTIGFDLVPGFSDLAIARRLDWLLAPTWAAVSQLAATSRVPAGLASEATAPVLFGAAVMVGRIAVNWSARELERRADAGAAERAAIKDGKDARARGGARARDAQTEKSRQQASRKMAIASYAEARAVLAATEMELTFLSLDIVGSTQMKHGEDPYVIEQSFTDYRALVERALLGHGAYKQTWTPDGQMAAFHSAQAAVDCACEILLALADFNRSTSRLRTEFRIRAGANSGTVSTDDETPMEMMSDFSIDVAGHLQKYADPDSLWISEKVHAALSDASGFEPAERDVDGHHIYVWKTPG
jgi:class 3 adenylate cyclase